MAKEARAAEAGWVAGDSVGEAEMAAEGATEPD